MHDAGTKYDSRNSELTVVIGERGGEVSTTRGPKATLSHRQEIILCSSNPTILSKHVDWDDADLSLDDGSSESGSDSEDSES